MKILQDLDGSFCSWFAGLVDGEGSFQIKHQKSHWWCELSISLREDDKEMLLNIQKELGCGHLYFHNEINSTNGQHNRFMLRFHNLAETQFLASLFECYPLRSKRAKDFLYWNKAIAELCKPAKQRDLIYLQKLYQEIRECRKFTPDSKPPHDIGKAWFEQRLAGREA
jgi:hypothetical protein